MIEHAHMIITEWPESGIFSLSSPELPGIVAAYDEKPSPAEVHSVAVCAGLAPSGDVIPHFETAIEVDGRQFFVRRRFDALDGERESVARRLLDLIEHEPRFPETVPVDQFGDSVIVAVLPKDSVERALESIPPETQAVLGTTAPDGRIVTVTVQTGRDEQRLRRLHKLGLEPESASSELLKVSRGHLICV